VWGVNVQSWKMIKMMLKINGRKVICVHCRKDTGFKIQKQTTIICKWCNKVVGYLGDKIK